jgi:ATP-dependent helicase HrpB
MSKTDPPASKVGFSDYPVSRLLGELGAALAEARQVLLSAPPGSGKSTIVPLALLDSPWLAGHSILMLEPRRLAARACAERMAQLLDQRVGRAVGYRVRLEQRISRETRIEVVTEGILTRRLQQDPGLDGVGLVVFDEIHERNLQADLGLALCRDIQRGLRDDLRLLLMSATADLETLERALKDPRVISGGEQPHPVQVRYLEREPQRPMAETAASGVLRALREQPGDLLVFLPGEAEIRRVGSLIGSESETAGTRLAPLFGSLDRGAQLDALRPRSDGCRRVVLATDIAETSLTIEGVSCVVDSGWRRAPRFDPNTALTRLETQRISKASAAQRSGRAGRLGPGVCYRLWTLGVQDRLPERSRPEILDADLSGLVLELALWGVSDPADLGWIDPPPRGALAQARDLLRALDALHSDGLVTAQGRRMAALGLHPRLAHLVLEGDRRGVPELGADLAALLSERDPYPRKAGEGRSADLADRLSLLAAWRDAGAAGVRAWGGDAGVCAQIDKLSARLRSRLDMARESSSNGASPGALLACAYPDRVGQRRDGASPVYRLASGGVARLLEDDPLRTQELLVVPSLHAGRAEGRIFLAAPVSRSELDEVLGEHLERVESVTWDARAAAVAAVAETRLGALILERAPLVSPDPEAVTAALMAGIRQAGLEVLAWTRSARRLQARVESLRLWLPQAGWPDISDRALGRNLEDWLAPWTNGVTRLEQLGRLDVERLLRSRLDWPRQQALDRLVPESITVPSGSRKRLEYRAGEPPVLAVRLQELFGLAETPKVCDGRVPVLLHLLSPAQRPIQVTQDLHGFWERTYPQVRRELKGRYPKHYWPEDPWGATPTARVRP